MANLRERARIAAAFLGRNMAIVISILSLGVAAFSLYFSISTQQLDRVYKEVSILPRLAIKLDVENFSISLDNSGLGPAVIHRVRFAIAGKCYDSDDSKSYQQKFREFTEGVFTYGIYKDTCRLLHTPSVKALPCDPGSLFPTLRLIREQLRTFLPLNALRSSP